MINDNKTDTQIVNELKMPLQTFCSYKKGFKRMMLKYGKKSILIQQNIGHQD